MEFSSNSILKLVKVPAPSLLILFSFILHACSGNAPGSVPDTSLKNTDTLAINQTLETKKNLQIQTIHVFVALCDNKYQGIVPVPEKIGNGQDAANNLYWGAAYGIKAFFNKSNQWKLIDSKKNPATNILERLIFKHRSKNIYLLADAYNGQFIKQTTIDFLLSCSGKGITTIKADDNEIPFGGASDILAYIGHDGLMDFSLSIDFKKENEENRKAIILACKSKQFFSSHLRTSGAEPLLWSTGLMAPEAYILHDALNEWIQSGNEQTIRNAAASAYSRYQKCSIKAAKNLLVSGW